MVKRIKESADTQQAAPARLFDSALAGQVQDSAQQIWLAGMGAFARAQAEGTKVFETLVKEGVSLQKQTQSATEERIAEVTSKMSSLAGGVQTRAGQHWDKLEGIFEERTAKALKKLGVPSAKEVDALVARIDELSAKLAKLSKSAPVKIAAQTGTKGAAGSAGEVAAKRPARRAPARKPAA